MVKTSIVLAIYNAERTLKECLNSIFIQNYKDFEVIIVDGGSTDSTLEIIESFKKNNKKIKLFHNPKKLSEGKGMSKDIGQEKSKGEYVIFLDHDNILEGNNWLNDLLKPLEEKDIMASQSMLAHNPRDSLFLKYVNSIGVEDPFAIPNSLVSQVTLHPENFDLSEKGYFVHKLNKNKVLYAGSNGCAFKKSVFKEIGGYTREVDVFYLMANKGMKVAVVSKARVNHKTSAKMLNFMIKKGKYFNGFFKSGYKYRKYPWINKGIEGKIKFALMLAYNLSFVGPYILAVKQTLKTRKLFWMLHPFYVFFITLEYIFIGILNLKGFFNYVR